MELIGLVFECICVGFIVLTLGFMALVAFARTMEFIFDTAPKWVWSKMKFMIGR